MSKISTTAAMIDSYTNTAIKNYVKSHDESTYFPKEMWDELTNEMDLFYFEFWDSRAKGIIS